MLPPPGPRRKGLQAPPAAGAGPLGCSRILPASRNQQVLDRPPAGAGPLGCYRILPASPNGNDKANGNVMRLADNDSRSSSTPAGAGPPASRCWTARMLAHPACFAARQRQGESTRDDTAPIMTAVRRSKESGPVASRHIVSTTHYGSDRGKLNRDGTPPIMTSLSSSAGGRCRSARMLSHPARFAERQRQIEKPQAITR